MKSSMKRTPVTWTIDFTSAEKRRIEMAAKECGWQPGEGAAFGRQLLLKNVASILRGAQLRQLQLHTKQEGGRS
jgi:hypothetical protein